MGVRVIASINGLGFLVTLVFWALVFFKKLVPPPGDLVNLSERANAATTRGFMIGDIVWSAPLLLMAALGLWRLRSWGWTAAQMVNALWCFSMTVVWVRDGYTVVSPGGVIFFPFVPVAIWATYYLWKRRSLFWGPEAK
jgi:hypothetical protein